jgi:hypothetical protein
MSYGIESKEITSFEDAVLDSDICMLTQSSFAETPSGKRMGGDNS